jgi:hypothetical protein
MKAHNFGNVSVVRGHAYTINAGMILCCAQGVNDHGRATDIGQWLSWKSRGAHSGRDDGRNLHGVKV